MDTGWRIRWATEADLRHVVNLDHEAFAPYGTAEDPQVIAARLTVFPEGFVVAENKDVLLGYGSSEMWFSEREPALNEYPTLTHHPVGRIFCITAMAVRRSHQRQGIGTAILQRLIAIAQRNTCTHILLETTHAQAFYLKHGFHIVREREQRGVTLYILKLELAAHA